MELKTTFYIYRHADNYYILLPEELKVSFLKQLSMYILRADVQLTDQSDSITRLGLCLEKSDMGQSDILNQLADNLAVLPLALTETELSSSQSSRQSRYIIVADIEQAESIRKILIFAKYINTRVFRSYAFGVKNNRPKFRIVC